MRGMDKNTGKALSGSDHLRQRVTDILWTPLGSRVQRRDYGSRLPRLVDRPASASLMIDMIAASADALARWEPEFRLESVAISQDTPGNPALDIFGIELVSGEPIALEGVSL